MEIKGGTWRTLFLLLLGQLVSFSLAICSFITSLISDFGVDAPLTQSFFSYMLLALVYGPILLRRMKTLPIPWYRYLVLVFIDAGGNCLGTCMAGLTLGILSDSGSADVQDFSKRPLLGDTIIVAATFFFAFSNVGEEYCVKKKDRVEFIAMLGTFGMLVTGVQLTLFERKKIEAINWSPTMIGLFTGYVVVFLVFRTSAPFLIKMSGATMFNLSLLTTDVWAVIIRIFFYHQQVNWIYYLAFAIVAIGLIIYSVNEDSSDDVIAASTTEHTTQYEQLPGELIAGANLD
uniref:Uncharacterized protein n=2 Tax=Avena sativa TaxID=4498 RepID=A0ACD5ZD98_AVESA